MGKGRDQYRKRHGAKPTIELSADESLCVLAAVIQGLAKFDGAEDREDVESALQLRSSAQKLRTMMGMDEETFLQFCHYAAGKPAEGAVRLFQEADARKRAGIPEGLGATGDFPYGALNEHDEGELRFAVGSDRETETVFLEFGKPVASVGMRPEHAEQVATALLKHAGNARH